MTKKKPVSITVDPATYAAMQEYATSSGLPLPELVKRMWSLWMTIDQAHGAIYPHPIADEKLDGSLENFLTEMQADEGPRLRDRHTGRFVVATTTDEESKLVEWLNDTDVEQY